MSFSKLSPKLIIGILLAIFFLAAFSIRVFLPYDTVFSTVGIKFTSVDGYTQMRLVDNLVHNFPMLMNFDPYAIYPGGSEINNIHFFNWLLAGIIWVIGLGSPSQHTIDVIGAYFPAILAALTVIPVYFIGKTLFNRWVGVIAAALFAVLPGEYMGRSILGFTDHHVAETLLSTLVILFLILAITTARQRALTLSHFRHRDWAMITRLLVYSLLAGFCLGIYLITWIGGLLLVFIISLYLVIQYIIDHLRHQSNDYLGIIGFITFLVTAIIVLPLSPDRLYYISLTFALLIPVVLLVISRVMEYWRMKPVYYPLILVGGGVAVLAAFYSINPEVFVQILGNFRIFAPIGATATTTLEMQPFLYPYGNFTTGVAWGNFTTSFFLIPADWNPDKLRWFPVLAIIPIIVAVWLWIKQRGSEKHKLLILVLCVLMVIAALVLWFLAPVGWKMWFPGFAIISLVILIWLFIKHHGDESQHLLFLIWTLIMLVLMLVQRRFAYYFVANVALLSAYISWQAIWLVSLRKLATKSEEIAAIIYKQARNVGVPIGIILIIVCIFFSQSISIFLPIWLIGTASLLYGGWGWAKYKGRNELWALWGLLPPIGFIPLALLKSKTVKDEEKGRHEERPSIPIYYINTSLVIIVVFISVFLLNIQKARDVAAKPLFAPSDAWQTSLVWMRDNTPEPFGDADAYYRIYEPPAPHQDFKYPESAYGVLSWWDYGYWITRVAHRLPNANPSQDPAPIHKVAHFFLSQDEASARSIIQEMGTSYIVIDHMTITSKFWAVVTWSDIDLTKFMEKYYLPYEGKLIPINLLYPEYYKSMVVRLYNFDGKAVTTESPAVITYIEKVDREGNRYNQITDIDEFSSYQEALDYVESQGPDNHRIVGINPFISPIALEAVQDYKLIHSSESGIIYQDLGMIPEVKVFEYIR